MADMPICEIAVKCIHCSEYFDSGIFLGSVQTFNTATLRGNQQQCPHCRKMTPCNKENMTYIGSNTK